MSTSESVEDATTSDAGAPKPRPDLVLVIGAILVVAVVTVGLLLWPTQAQAGAGALFDAATRVFGVPVQLIGLACLLMAVVLALSKVGNIRLGEGKPQYSTPSWLFMFISAGLGSATMYWAFMEWAYYYQTPGLDITPESREALDISTSYAFFHWGPIPWAMYVVAGVAMAYYFHVRGGNNLSFGGLVEAITRGRVKAHGVWGRVIDILFLFGTFGGLILTVTVTVNTVSAGLAALFNIENNFVLKGAILLVSALAFGLSSFLGIGAGLQRLSKAAVLGSLLFAAVVFVVGPTEFISNNIVNSLGLELQNFFHMALYTDANGGSSFSRDWTVFYWLYWVSYLPGVAIFITRVSKGRTIRQTVLGLIIAGSVGVMFFFGVLSSYAIFQTTSGTVDAPALLTSQGGDYAVAELLNTLPLGHVFSVVYFIITLLFLASHLDATAFTVAAVSTRNLPHGKDPARSFRLFWVLMLVTIPMSMLAINANLGTLKTGLTLTSVPFLILLVVAMVGLIRWLRKDLKYLDAESGLMRLPQDDTTPAPLKLFRRKK